MTVEQCRCLIVWSHVNENDVCFRNETIVMLHNGTDLTITAVMMWHQFMQAGKNSTDNKEYRYERSNVLSHEYDFNILLLCSMKKCLYQMLQEPRAIVLF